MDFSLNFNMSELILEDKFILYLNIIIIYSLYHS